MLSNFHKIQSKKHIATWGKKPALGDTLYAEQRRLGAIEQNTGGLNQGAAIMLRYEVGKFKLGQ